MTKLQRPTSDIAFCPCGQGFWPTRAQPFISILPQNARRFAAKCILFCGKMQTVLRQNANRFGPKCKSFWAKMQTVLGQNANRFGPKCKPFWAKMQSVCTSSAKKKVKKTERKGTFSIIFRTFAPNMDPETGSLSPTRPALNTKK